MPTLDPYQELAVDHLRRNPKAGLFLDMGLGKTAIALSSLTDDDLPVLVIAPKRVRDLVWPVEIPKWRPDLTFAVAAGTKRFTLYDKPTTNILVLGGGR